MLCAPILCKTKNYFIVTYILYNGIFFKNFNKFLKKFYKNPPNVVILRKIHIYKT